MAHINQHPNLLHKGTFLVDRDIVQLRYYEHPSWRSIAAQMQRSEGYLRKRNCLKLKKIKGTLIAK
jgi:hypothetical protein